MKERDTEAFVYLFVYLFHFVWSGMALFHHAHTHTHTQQKSLSIRYTNIIAIKLPTMAKNKDIIRCAHQFAHSRCYCIHYVTLRYVYVAVVVVIAIASAIAVVVVVVVLFCTFVFLFCCCCCLSTHHFPSSSFSFPSRFCLDLYHRTFSSTIGCVIQQVHVFQES